MCGEGKPVFFKGRKLNKTFREEFEDIGYFASDRDWIPEGSVGGFQGKKMKGARDSAGDKSIGDEGWPMHLRLPEVEGKSSSREHLEKSSSSEDSDL